MKITMHEYMNESIPGNLPMETTGFPPPFCTARAMQRLLPARVRAAPVASANSGATAGLWPSGSAGQLAAWDN